MSRYEMWFRSEPFYMASVSLKTFKMLLRREPSNISRFRRITGVGGPERPPPRRPLMEREDMTDATMIERAARAVRDVVEGERSATTYKDIARAVLMAVREPDDATVTRACDRGYYSAPDLEIHFGAMIDAILADGEGR